MSERMQLSKDPDYGDFQTALTEKTQTGLYPWELAGVVWSAPDLQSLHERAIREAELRKSQFPGGTDRGKELEASKEFALAARLVKKMYGSTRSSGRLLTGPDGKYGGLLGWAQPDWDLVLYCAKLLRYIGLCGQYEMLVFTTDQCLARDVREVRHKALLEKWPPV